MTRRRPLSIPRGRFSHRGCHRTEGSPKDLSNQLEEPSTLTGSMGLGLCRWCGCSVADDSFGLEKRLEEMMNELPGKMSKEVVIESLEEECRRAHKLDSSRMSSNLVLRILAANSET